MWNLEQGSAGKLNHSKSDGVARREDPCNLLRLSNRRLTQSLLRSVEKKQQTLLGDSKGSRKLGERLIKAGMRL